MEFRLLGPVEVCGDNRAVPLGETKPRALLLDHGRVVPTDRLVEAIWGDAPSQTARGRLADLCGQRCSARSSVPGCVA